MSENNGNNTSLRLKTGLAEMLKGGVIMDVMSVEQAEVAEKAGATAVMALERVPAIIRAEGGVSRMANPKLIRQIMAAVSIPVMAKCRIGHFAEAQILQETGRRLHRRVRGTDPGRRRASREQARLQDAVRLRRAQSGRGAAAHCRRRGHDPHQGRSWNRRCDSCCQAHAADS